MPYYRATAKFRRHNIKGEIEDSERTVTQWATNPGEVIGDLLRQVHSYDKVVGSVVTDYAGPFNSLSEVI